VHSLTPRSKSKQYLTAHTIDAAHPTDIFALAATPTSLLTASGASALKVFATAGAGPGGGGDASGATPTEAQTLAGAHALGAHHVAAASRADVAVSAGFAGEARVWRRAAAAGAGWRAAGALAAPRPSAAAPSPSPAAAASGSPPRGEAPIGDVWAVAVSARGEYAATTAADGRVRVWDLRGGEGAGAEKVEAPVVREYETRGSFGMCVDMVCLACLPRRCLQLMRDRVPTASSLRRGMRAEASLCLTTTRAGCCIRWLVRLPAALSAGS
jgi:superkiller protein 8